MKILCGDGNIRDIVIGDTLDISEINDAELSNGQVAEKGYIALLNEDQTQWVIINFNVISTEKFSDGDIKDAYVEITGIDD